MSVPVRSTLRSTLLWAVVPAAIVYAVALVWSGAEGISAKLVLKDLAQSFKAPLGEGFLSSVGYLLWMAAVAIALFAASTRQIQGSVLNGQFAFCGGGFSLWLCLDDMFLVYDRYLGEALLYISPTPSSPGCCCSASVVPCGASVATPFWCPWCCWACRF
ncbi:hypothetical protein [Synechococcus sp. N19]|uniref:hypothetical protein n=1 Tax=Synechococcus sp. N19 TaxID=2575512 RepID=UPI001FCB2833|nr:hypothetical protein [Synechococcus sp. N19]